MRQRVAAARVSTLAATSVSFVGIDQQVVGQLEIVGGGEGLCGAPSTQILFYLATEKVKDVSVTRKSIFISSQNAL
jgi:hypothetical protein